MGESNEGREFKMHTDIPQLHWQNWIQRWDKQQDSYLPDRERRFTAMLDALEVLLPEHFVVLDLACGPGSISQRLLSRFPQAHAIAVDFDPVLLLLGQQALGDMQGRLRWVDADISEPSWQNQLGELHVDAVLSTTALHWLLAGQLVDLYHQLGDLIRPGGIFLNGDNFGFAPHLPSFKTISERGHARWSAEAAKAGQEDWKMWWEAMRREPGMEPLFVERERRFINKAHYRSHTLAEVHQAALRDAGFHEVGVIWQHLDNRVIMAVR